jgi:hypothetical protein
MFAIPSLSTIYIYSITNNMCSLCHFKGRFKILLKFLGAFTKLRNMNTCFIWFVHLPVCLVCVVRLHSHWTDFHEIWYLRIFKKLLRKFKFVKNLSRLTSASHEDRCTFMIIYHWILLRMRNISDRSCIENQTHILCSLTSF